MMNNKIIAKRYMIVSQIGSGGMADVYVAVDTLLNREVAIKVLRGELSNDPVSLLRFQREANASTALNHPNIVDIYDVGEEDGQHYIVMEYIRGRNLKNLIASRGALDKEEAVDIMRQLVSATQEAHKAGIIHRDIKPQNVLIKDDGTLKMVDFGIALAQDAIQLTQSDSVMGSVHYMAPELARGEAATNQSDIYSLGIVFYELLCGEVPYRADAPVQVALKHMRDEIPSVRQINPTLPQSVENIVLKSTAKNKSFRYRTVSDMEMDLMLCLLPEHRNDPKVEFEMNNEKNQTIVMDKVSKAQPVKKKPFYKKPGIMAAIFGGILVFILAGWLIADNLNRAKLMEIPDLSGHTLEEAKEILKELHLEVNLANVIYVITDDVEQGQITASNPSFGAKVERGTQIGLTISDGVYQIVEDYTKIPIDQAKNKLAQYPKIRVLVTEEQSQEEPGTVIRQELLLAGDKIDPRRNADIRLVISAYQSLVIPQNLIGMKVEEAKSLLEGKGAQVLLYPMSEEGLSEEEIASLQRGVVIRCTPDVGSAYTQEKNSYVTLYYY